MPRTTPIQHADKGRITSFDALKGVGIIAVICLHVPLTNPPPGIWHALSHLCRFAVPAFFIISGYFFMHAWQRTPDSTQLIRKYAARLLKVFLFWAFFFAIVPPFVGGAPHGVRSAVLQNIENILRHPHCFFLTGYVYHLWFLSSLLQGITLLWLFLRYWNLRGALIFGVAIYIISLLGSSYSGTSFGFKTHFDMKSGPFVSTLFVGIGAWLALQPRFSIISGITLALMGLALYLVELSMLQGAGGYQPQTNGFLLGTVPYALGIVWIALSKPDHGRLMAGLGSASLGLYILHVYIIEIMRYLRMDVVFSSADSSG